MFRLSRNSAFDDFTDGGLDDTMVSAVPKGKTLARLRAAFPGRRFDPVDLRLVRYTHADSQYVLATTRSRADRITEHVPCASAQRARCENS